MKLQQYKTRRWWQISIRELLLLTVIVGLSVGWWADRKMGLLSLMIQQENLMRLEERRLEAEYEAARRLGLNPHGLN